MTSFVPSTEWIERSLMPPFAFVPNAQFVILRSYIYKLQFLDETGALFVSGNEFTIALVGSPGYAHVYKIFEHVLDWSSNRYTLDHIVEDCWWRDDANPTHHPQAYSVTYFHDPIDKLPTIKVFNPFSQAASANYVLPPAPPNYWLPPFV